MNWDGVDRRTGEDRRSSSCSFPKNENIERIAEITKMLKVFGDHNIVKYRISEGNATAIGIVEKPGEFQSMILSLPKGSQFISDDLSRLRNHENENEFGIIIRGRLDLEFSGGNNQIISAGEHFKFERENKANKGSALEDTEIYFIAVPSVRGKLNGK
jgi:hypothetical protein